jgi:tetratricopeptide (TPR) repeat protein
MCNRAAKLILIISAIVFLFSFSSAFAKQEKLPAIVDSNIVTDDLFSPAVAKLFYDIAVELTSSETIDQNHFNQAMMFYQAAASLDKTSTYFMPDMINLACKQKDVDNSRLVYRLLINYINSEADLNVASRGLQYLTGKINSREQREMLLGSLSRVVSKKNKAFNSEMSTLAGLMAVERGDMLTAANSFISAFSEDRYNSLAYQKLTELMPEQITPDLSILQFRSQLSVNPLDISAAVKLAEQLQKLELYDIANDAYEYSADLFKYHEPSKPVPDWIYRPWLLNCYNSKMGLPKGLEVADMVRKEGRFDLFVEMYTSLIYEKMGEKDKASEIFKEAVNKAQNDFDSQTDVKAQSEIASQIAYVYSFGGYPDNQIAVNWANKACSLDQNSPSINALLGYCLARNNEPNAAQAALSKSLRNPVSALAVYLMNLDKSKKEDTANFLRGVIFALPGSLESRVGKKLLAENGSDYVSPINPSSAEAALQGEFGKPIIPKFTTIDKFFTAQLSFMGNNFSYGNEIKGTLIINNKSSLPLLISDNSVFTGSIRVDGKITGDINQDLPNLFFNQIRPSEPIKPNSSLAIPLSLTHGKFKKLLEQTPQASLDITFTVYLDPVIKPDGSIENRIANIKPLSITVKRPPIKITRGYLQNKFNVLSKGDVGPKLKSFQLFSGLLLEEQMMANRDPLYKFVYSESMPALFKSAVNMGLNEKDWAIKTQAMYYAMNLPTDYQMIQAISNSLEDSNWPARLMALYILSNSQGKDIQKLLNWKAEYDQSYFVREMAVSLGGLKPKAESDPNKLQKPAFKPDPNALKAAANSN